MAKIRHIALATDNPEKTAKFYKDVFDFKEVGRVEEGKGKLGWGVFLTDGTLNIAVLKFTTTDQLGRGLDYVGIHHFGILVDDVDEKIAKIESTGAKVFMKRPPGNTAFFETKVRGPDGVVLDISDEAWIGNPEMT